MGERVTGHTILIGLMATPIRHSSSPLMHNTAFAELGLDYCYMAFEVGREQLADAMQSVRALGMRGCNVSMPNKTVVAQYLDHVSEEARLIGSVNTVVNDNGVLTGYCTDGMGWMDSLRDKEVDLTGKKITIVGAGGAATAIAIEAALEGVGEISIFNRRDAFFRNAVATVEKIRRHTDCRAEAYDLDSLDDLREQTAGSAVLANATNIGMKPLEGQTWLTDTSILRPDLIVTDVVYAPVKSRFLELAEEAGCRTMNGFGMMIFQGAKAFELWTGQKMPVDSVKRALGLEDEAI